MNSFTKFDDLTNRLAGALADSVASVSLLRMLFLALVAVVCGNAILFSLAAATPLIQADGWYFLEHFLPRYFDGSLTFADMFMQRGGTDHSQPLQKLVLLFHTRYFDMDFRVEGVIGVLFGVLWCLAVAREMRSERSLSLARNLGSYAGILLVFALGLSLNSTNIFTWPLVTLGYLALLLSTLYFSFAMTSWGRRRSLVVLLVTMSLSLCIDSQAIVVVIAMSLALAPLRTQSRRDSWRQLLAALSGLLLARGLLWWLARQSGGFEAPVGARGRPVLTVLSEPGALQGLLAPFSDSLVHLEHLVKYFPTTYSKMMLVCAVVVASLHIWFWIRAFLAWRNDRYSRTVAMAVFLMLLTYGMTAAIIIGRVPMFDWNYLHQPRYVLTYQVSLVAIAMMLQVTIREARIPSLWHAIEPSAIVLVIGALMTSQVKLAREAWILPHYLTSYWQNAAMSMQSLANNPRADASECPDIMSVCEYSPERREQLMTTLTQRQLNIFSPRFQMRNRIYPELAAIPGFGNIESTYVLDESILAAPHPATLRVTQEETCATGAGMLAAEITIQTNGMAPDGAQLWAEAIGGPRLLLGSVARDQPSLILEKQLPNGSHLTLIHNSSNRILAKADLTLERCAASP